MSKEQGEKQEQFPFQRMETLFNQASQERSRSKDERRLKLGDGTEIDINIGRPFPGSRSIFDYSFRVKPFGKTEDVRENSDSQVFSFEISNEDELRISKIPLMILSIGNMKFLKTKQFNANDVSSKQENMAMGNILIDWAEKILQENKYSDPPIAASIFRTQVQV